MKYHNASRMNVSLLLALLGGLVGFMFLKNYIASFMAFIAIVLLIRCAYYERIIQLQEESEKRLRQIIAMMQRLGGWFN